MEKENKVSGLKLACAVLETLFAIPILGGTIIMGLLWIPLVCSLALHIVTLALTKRERKITGNVLGIIASTVGLIPFVGWILHIVTAIFCWKETFNTK